MEITAEKRLGRRILHHIHSLAFPRLAGSPGEQKAQAYIRDSFLFSEYEVLEQEFTFSPTAVDSIPRIGIAIISSLVLTAFLLLSVSTLFSIGFCLIALLSVLFSMQWSSVTERLYGMLRHRSGVTKNIVALHPSRSNALNILFTAHYDSKSQTYSGAFRMVLYVVLICLVFLSLVLISITALAGWESTFLLFLLVPMTVVAIATQCTSTGNDSPGACDNASGVGVILELAHALARTKPSVNIAFVAMGAEEMGLCGSMAFLKEKHFRELFPPRRTIVINFDTVGCASTIRVIDRYGIPPRQTGGLLAHLCLRIGERFGIPVQRGWIPVGALLDHIPFATNGYQSVTLTSAGWNKTFRLIHTEEDSVESLSISALEHSFAVGQEIIDSIHMARQITSTN